MPRSLQFFLKLANMPGSDLRRTRRQFDHVKVVDDPGLQWRREPSAYEFRYRFAKCDLPALGVCFYFPKDIII